MPRTAVAEVVVYAAVAPSVAAEPVAPVIYPSVVPLNVIAPAAETYASMPYAPNLPITLSIVSLAASEITLDVPLWTTVIVPAPSPT